MATAHDAICCLDVVSSVTVTATVFVAHAMSTGSAMPAPSSAFLHRNDLELAAKLLDFPMVRKWRYYWSPETAIKMGEAFFWMVLSRAEFSAIYDGRLQHMQGEARMR